MKKIVIVLLFFVALVSISCANKAAGEVNVVSPEEMQTLLSAKEVQLVDLRTSSEYTEGHIEHAQNLDFKSPTFDEDIKKLDKDKPVLLYCLKGVRSAKCAKKMMSAGFKKIYDLDGGISKWQHKGFKIKI